jgi:hypothetical protein
MTVGGQAGAPFDQWLGLIWPAGYVAPASKGSIMTDVSKAGPASGETSRPLTPLEIFFIKLGGVTVAAMVFLVCSVLFFQAVIESKTADLSLFKGGRAFWETLENKVDALANAPDLPPERKAKIIATIRKLSDKYRPYIDAAAGSPPPH